MNANLCSFTVSASLPREFDMARHKSLSNRGKVFALRAEVVSPSRDLRRFAAWIPLSVIVACLGLAVGPASASGPVDVPAPRLAGAGRVATSALFARAFVEVEGSVPVVVVVPGGKTAT